MVTENSRLEMPNLLLVMGNGRNVGKTYVVRKIINFLAKKGEVTGVKISPHFHPIENGKILFQSDKFIILDEDQINYKDSSLMLQAGAEKVYFVMATQGNLKSAFEQLRELLPDTAIVCESGGLLEITKPGISFFVNRTGKEITKNQFTKYSPIMVLNDGESINFDISKISFQNNRFSIV